MKTQIRNILVPVNFSNAALNALHTALCMAKRQQAHLDLLYVQDISDYYPEMGTLAALQPMMSDVFTKDEYILEKISEAIRKDLKIDCEAHSATGVQAIVIAEMAGQLNSDLIIMGTPEGLSDSGYLFDSIAYTVLQDAPCHVMTVPAGQEINIFSNIMFAARPATLPINNWGPINPIIQINRASVHLLGLVEHGDGNVLNAVNALLDNFKDRLAATNAQISSDTFYTDDAVQQTLHAAEEVSADLLVIPAETDRNIWEYFFGNFTQKMIRKAQQAVLCVKTDQLSADHKNSYKQQNLVIA